MENIVRKIKILGNNEKSLILTKNPKSQNQTKHIDIMYCYICKLIENSKLAIDWIEKSTMLSDSLIKAFFIALLKKH